MTIDFRTAIEKQLDRANKKMNIDFTATTAKKLVDNFNNLIAEQSRKEFLIVADKITKSATVGKSNLTIYESLSNAVSKQLIDRGFLVKFTSNQHDGDFTEISWE